MTDTITCSACGRSILECIGETMCAPAAAGFARTKGVPAEHCRELASYTATGRRGGEDYRAEALSRDPSLTSSVERMCGSWGLAYVVRTGNGYQLAHAEDERCAWAGACGSTRNTRYDAEVRDKPRKPVEDFYKLLGIDRVAFRPAMSDAAERRAEARALGMTALD